MGINLAKGQKVSLTKENPSLAKVVIGLGWDVNRFDTGYDYDLDASAFLLTDTGKVASQEDFIFYGNQSALFPLLTHSSSSEILNFHCFPIF